MLRSPEGDALRARLRGHVDRLRPGHPSPIIAVVLGDEAATPWPPSAALLDRGLLVPAIRPPTVAAGHVSRLRIALSAAHTDDQVDRLARRARRAWASRSDGRPVSGAPPRAHWSLVVGTGTEVGKTWVAAHLLRDLRAEGLTVAARKPAQSFEPRRDRTTDADVLGARHRRGPRRRVPAAPLVPACPWRPPMAADALGRPPFTIADLVAEIAWPDSGPTIGLVETAGGVRSPHGRRRRRRRP